MSRRQKGQPRESTLERRYRQYLGELYRGGQIFTFRPRRNNKGGNQTTPEGPVPLYHGSRFIGYAL